MSNMTATVSYVGSNSKKLIAGKLLNAMILGTTNRVFNQNQPSPVIAAACAQVDASNEETFTPPVNGHVFQNFTSMVSGPNEGDRRTALGWLIFRRRAACFGHPTCVANHANYERGAVKTAKQLGINALPPNTLFECEVHEVLLWHNEAAEMRQVVEAIWRTRDIIDGKRYVLPADFKRGP